MIISYYYYYYVQNISSRVVIRAAVNIKKGEHISINYSDPMWGTCNRQIHLGESFAVMMMMVGGK